MQRYLAVVMEIAVKVPLQKASVSQSVTHQNAVILTPILFAVIDGRGSESERGATPKFWPRGGPFFRLEGGNYLISKKF